MTAEICICFILLAYSVINEIAFVIKVAQLMKQLKMLHEHKMKQRRIAMRDRAAQHQKQQEREDAKRDVKQRELKKQIYRHLGKEEKRKSKGRFNKE